MAHSSTVASITTSDEVNYFYKDEYGKIHRVVKQIEIKQEPIGNSSTKAVHSTDAGGNVGTLTQMNTNAPQFVRIQNSYNVQLDDNTSTTTYTLMAPQGSCSKSNCTTTNNMQRHQQQQRACEGSNNIKYVPINNCNNRQQQPHLEHTQNVTKTEERFTKYTQPQIVGNTKSSAKSKLHSTVHQNASVVQRKRKPEKAGKGLRHFSLKVCEKVKVKGTTTYNEVADELVAEEIQNQTFDSSNCDQKNIRRRVYDALNVLMALQIISKDKKEIRWIGLPTNTVEECTILEEENEERRERIKQKHEQLRELLLQLVSFKSLIERNKDAERQGVIPTPNSSIQLPFIIVNTHKSTKINCSVTNDKSEYIFKFDDKFEMHDDAEVLKRMGLLFGLDKGQCSYEDIERAKSLVPPNFEKYIEVYGSGKDNVEDGGDASCGSEDEMPSYDFTELTNDSSRYGFIHATNDDLTLATPSLTASQELPLMAGSSGRGGGRRVAIGENEEFANNSDID